METVKNLHKLRCAIARHGMDCTITRQDGVNEFGEPLQEQTEVLNGRGLYHTGSGFFSVTFPQSGQVPTKRQDKLLLLYTDLCRVGDTIVLPLGAFKITGIENTGGLNLCVDISMEV